MRCLFAPLYHSQELSPFTALAAGSRLDQVFTAIKMGRPFGEILFAQASGQPAMGSQVFCFGGRRDKPNLCDCCRRLPLHLEVQAAHKGNPASTWAFGPNLLVVCLLPRVASGADWGHVICGCAAQFELTNYLLTLWVGFMSQGMNPMAERISFYSFRWSGTDRISWSASVEGLSDGLWTFNSWRLTRFYLNDFGE